jgi:flagellar biosynthesis component FlhA
MKLDKRQKIVKEIGIVVPVLFMVYLLLVPVNPVLLDTLMILYIVVIPLLLFCRFQKAGNYQKHPIFLLVWVLLNLAFNVAVFRAILTQGDGLNGILGNLMYQFIFNGPDTVKIYVGFGILMAIALCQLHLTMNITKSLSNATGDPESSKNSIASGYKEKLSKSMSFISGNSKFSLLLILIGTAGSFFIGIKIKRGTYQAVVQDYVSYIVGFCFFFQIHHLLMLVFLRSLTRNLGTACRDTPDVSNQ